MKRKTNLFYDFGDDSNFLTFSNYTEALTGNFVSTNTKLFPSKFLCIYMPSLDDGYDAPENVKENFINNELCGYYENKLAFLRDKLIENKKIQGKTTYTIESELFSLSYLLECIKNFDEDSKIVYVGDISEQDFNGTYTDIICVVDSMYYKSVKNGWPEKIENPDKDIYETPDNDLKDKLYGWFYMNEENNVQAYFEGNNKANEIAPKYDEDNGYNILSIYENLELENVISPGNPDVEENEQIKELKFNIIIPLFDIINIDYKSNLDVIEEKNTIDISKSNESYISNVPLGIWFSPDYLVTLKRDFDKKYAQTWSLVIGSQFKPFPYSSITPNEIDRDIIAGSYSTFAQIMKNQNAITDSLNKLQNSLNSLSERLTSVENTINNSDITTNGANNLRLDFLQYKSEVNNILNNFQEQLNQTQLQWVNREG